MLRIILLTLLSVVILTIGGEMIYGLASCIAEHGSHDTLVEYLAFSFDRVRWEHITGNLFVSAFTILVCLRFFDKLSCK